MPCWQNLLLFISPYARFKLSITYVHGKNEGTIGSPFIPALACCLSSWVGLTGSAGVGWSSGCATGGETGDCCGGFSIPRGLLGPLLWQLLYPLLLGLWMLWLWLCLLLVVWQVDNMAGCVWLDHGISLRWLRAKINETWWKTRNLWN